MQETMLVSRTRDIDKEKDAPLPLYRSGASALYRRLPTTANINGGGEKSFKYNNVNETVPNSTLRLNRNSSFNRLT